MRVKSREFGKAAECDLTPMIDMTFQLIAFFMVLVNFTQAEQDKRVDLPASKLAKPPEDNNEMPLTIQLARVKDSNPPRFISVVGGEEVAVGPALEGILNRERRAAKGTRGMEFTEVIVVIRADRNVPTGQVQEVIELCQQVGFERFRLRAKEEP